MSEPKPEISFEDFERIDVRAGTVTRSEAFPEARKPAYKLWIDFGEGIGVKRSSAQITEHYGAEELIGRKVLGVVNFAPRQIGSFVSEVLTLGVYATDGSVILVGPDRDVRDGARLG